MCHYQAVRHAHCGHFSQVLIYACPIGDAPGSDNGAAGNKHCHDRREDQGTRQEDTFCASCRGREAQRRRHGEADDHRSLLAEVRLKTATATGSVRTKIEVLMLAE